MPMILVVDSFSLPWATAARTDAVKNALRWGIQLATFRIEEPMEIGITHSVIGSMSISGIGFKVPFGGPVTVVEDFS